MAAKKAPRWRIEKVFRAWDGRLGPIQRRRITGRTVRGRNYWEALQEARRVTWPDSVDVKLIK